MKLPVVDKCCCCLSLRTGILVLGGFTAATSLLALILTIVRLEEIEAEIRDKHNETELMGVAVLVEEKENYTVVERFDMRSIDLEGYEISIVFYGLRLMLSVILIVGAKKRDVVFLNIYIVYLLIQITLLSIWIFVEIIVPSETLNWFKFIDLGIQMYIYIIVRSLILEVQTSQIQEYDEKNWNAFKNTEVN